MRRGRNLDRGFEVVNDPQVTEASRRQATRLNLQALLVGAIFAAAVAVIPA